MSRALERILTPEHAPSDPRSNVRPEIAERGGSTMKSFALNVIPTRA